MIVLAVLIALTAHTFANQFYRYRVGPNTNFSVLLSVNNKPTDINARSTDPPSPPLRVTKVLELNSTEQCVVHILYDEDVQNTTVEGDVVIADETTQPRDKHWLLVPYLEKTYKGNLGFLLMGHINNSDMEYLVKIPPNDAITVYLRIDADPFPTKVIRIPFAERPEHALSTTTSHASQSGPPALFFLYALAALIGRED
ncbi:hypothetical protein AAHC03_022704 [Spirometra sp. Aus1]